MAFLDDKTKDDGPLSIAEGFDYWRISRTNAYPPYDLSKQPIWILLYLLQKVYLSWSMSDTSSEVFKSKMRPVRQENQEWLRGLHTCLWWSHFIKANMFYSITFCQLLQIILQLFIRWYFLDDFWIISCQSSRIPQPTAPRNSGACVVRGAVLGGCVTGGGLRTAENHLETGMISMISHKQAYKTLLKPNKKQRFLLLVNDSKWSINIEHMHMSYLYHEFHEIFEYLMNIWYLKIFDMMIFVNPCESHLVPASSTVSSTALPRDVNGPRVLLGSVLSGAWVVFAGIDRVNSCVAWAASWASWASCAPNKLSQYITIRNHQISWI